MDKYLIGIDCGGTNVKAVIFDTAGHEIASASAKYGMTYPHSGWCECNPEDIWTASYTCLREAVAKSGVDPARILGVGATAWGTGAFFLDQNGDPSYPAVHSSDGRTIDLCNRLSVSGKAAEIEKINKVGAVTCHTAVIARWLKENEPEAYANTAWICAAKDYINFKLTGERLQEPNDVSGAGFYDWETKNYAYRIFDILEIPEMGRKLAPLAGSSLQLAGKVTEESAALTGLLAGTPVVAGMMDICACALGTGISREDVACAIVGTWSINEVACKDKMFTDTIATLVHAIDGKILSNAGGCTSATNTEWFLRCFGKELRQRAMEEGVSVYQLMTDMAGSISPGGTDVMYLPFISSPRIRLNASAGFYNIQADTRMEELLYALYEGITFDHRRYMDVFISQGLEINTYRLAGGGAKSPYWSQLFADVLGKPVEIVDASELGAMGICIAAGIAVGEFRDFEDACGRMIGDMKVYCPDEENRRKLQARYEKWTGLVAHMCEYWDRELEKPGD